MKALMPAAILAALGAAPALAAPAAPSTALPPVFWMISPAEAGCRTELELTGRSGAAVTVALNSDGELVSLSFPKENLPERAFLPIRIDRKAHANLMLRKADGRSGELVLSEETLAALRRGGELDIAWLAGEPLGTSLMGSGQAIDDLKTCGAQVAAEIRARRTAEADAKARAEAEARAKAVADAQIEAAKAQAAAADAERQQLAAAAERQRRAEADALAAQERDRERLYAEQRRERQLAENEQRRRDYEAAQRRRAWEAERESAYYPPPPPTYVWPPAYGRRW